MEHFLATLAYLLIGMGLRRVPGFPRETGAALNALIIHVSLPALVLLKVPQLRFSPELLILLVMPWGALLFGFVLVRGLSRLLAWDRPTTGCLLLLVPLANTAFLGIPMVSAFLGPGAVPYALFYDQFGSFIALLTYGSLILTLYGSGDSVPTARQVVSRICTFPPFLALVVALALHGLPLPQLLRPLLTSLAEILVPVVMIAVGWQLTLRLPREILAPLGAGLAIRLVAVPLAALLVCRLLGLEGEVVRVAILEAAMPPMVAAGALAAGAGLVPALAAALVGAGVLLSFVTLPLLFFLLP